MLDQLNIQPSSNKPIFRQLYEQVQALIAGGRLPPGSALPSVRQIAKQLQINPMTVSRAIQLLTDEGWLQHQRGQASTVADPLPNNNDPLNRSLRKDLTAVIHQAQCLQIEQAHFMQWVSDIWKENSHE